MTKGMVGPDIPVTKLIPQRPPFVMVDRMLSCDKKNAVTEFLVREDNILLDDMQLSPAGIIENMAQSCAARMGYVNMMKGESIKIGYIGDVRDCVIQRLPKCHELIQTHIQIVEEVFHLTLAYVHLEIDGETIASSRMKIALTDIELQE